MADVAPSEFSKPFTRVLSSKFPSLDKDLSQYIIDVLSVGKEDFNSSDDIYEAVGCLLEEASGGTKEEEEIREICQELMEVIQLEAVNNGHVPAKLTLDAPVMLGTDLDASLDENDSIWIVKQDTSTIVDRKKLEKAEAKIKAKQERRAVKDAKDEQNGKPSAAGQLDTAAASQSSNRREGKLESAGVNRSLDVRIENFDLSFGERGLLKEANLFLANGRRYGLVGRNGAGKSTLLRVMAKRELFIPSHISILCVEQEVVGDETIVLDSVLECDVERTRLLTEEKTLLSKAGANSSKDDHCDRLAQVYARLQEIEADKAPARASTILAGLGFSDDMMKFTTKELSGGWRMRLALARTLFSRPDLLMLDEPTNMLDLKAVLWLEKYLQEWPTTILVVSHDRCFLDAVTTDVVHMHSRRLDSYKGNYEHFIKTKTEKLKNQKKEYEAQVLYREHLQAFINKFRYNAKRASLVQSRIKALEKLPEIQPVIIDPPVVLKFPDCEKLSPPILQLDEVSFYYEVDKILFSSVNLPTNMESRIALVGENGTGKTTLLKILLGELEPKSGLRICHRNLKLGYFSQHHVDQLTFGQSAMGILASKFPGLTEGEYRSQLARYGVSSDLASRPVLSLSGGQKSRVVFAVVSMSKPNFLVLDEPTNHLDAETIEALGKALTEFKGGVVLVSHDERLIQSVCNEVWVCGNGTVTRLEGGYDQYKKSLEDQLQSVFRFDI